MNKIFLFIFILYQGILTNGQQQQLDIAIPSSNGRPCSSMPCKNGAFCSDQMTDSFSGYSCSCLSGWSGLNCDIQKRSVEGPMFGAPFNSYNPNVAQARSVHENINIPRGGGSPDEGLSQPFISGREDANDRKKKGSVYESGAYKNWSPEKDWARQDWPQAKWNQYNHDQLIGKNSWPSNDNHYYWPVGYDWWRWDNAYPHKSTAYPIEPYRTVPPVYPNTYNSYGKIYYGDGLDKTKIVAIVLGILIPVIAISVVAWAVYFFWIRKKRYRR